MKLLHCSDILVGLAFSHLAAKADRLRQQRLTTLKNLLTRAKREKVDGIILAGNTLADNRLPRQEVQELSTILQSSSAPVFLLPGQTDPYTPDSPYRLYPELFQDPVQVLGGPTPLKLAAATLYPCPVRARGGTGNPTAWISPRQKKDGVRLGVACAPHLEALPEVDYLAMGGRGTPERLGVAWWSGSLEPANYSDERGHAQMVSIEPGVTPNVQSLRTGALQWQERSLVMRGAEKLRDDLEALKEPHTLVLRLTLRGQIGVDQFEGLSEKLAAFSKKVFHLELDNRLEFSPLQAERYHNPLLRTMVSCLAEATSSPLSDPSAELPDPHEAARRALLHLGALLRESQQEDLI